MQIHSQLEEFGSDEGKRKKDLWVKFHQIPFLLEVLGPKANQKDLTKITLKVLLYLTGKMTTANYVNGSQEEHAASLGLSPQAYSKALGSLERVNFLVRKGGRGRTRALMINPAYVSCGRGTDLPKRHAMFEEYKERKAAASQGPPVAVKQKQQKQAVVIEPAS